VRALAEVGAHRLASARDSYRVAIDKDPRDWALWFELAQASQGRARRVALERALRLNPRSPEISQYAASVKIPGLGR
jgi:hypothetical protein